MLPILLGVSQGQHTIRHRAQALEAGVNGSLTLYCPIPTVLVHPGRRDTSRWKKFSPYA